MQEERSRGEKMCVTPARTRSVLQKIRMLRIIMPGWVCPEPASQPSTARRRPPPAVVAHRSTDSWCSAQVQPSVVRAVPVQNTHLNFCGRILSVQGPAALISPEPDHHRQH
jgi:hypothetical protein